MGGGSWGPPSPAFHLERLKCFMHGVGGPSRVGAQYGPGSLSGPGGSEAPLETHRRQPLQAWSRSPQEPAGPTLHRNLARPRSSRTADL